MVSTEDKTETTTTPYQNTDNDRKKRYLLIGTVFICYTIVYIIIIMLSMWATKPKLNKDSSTIKTEAILLDASMTPYNFNKDTLTISDLNATTAKNNIIGNNFIGATIPAGKVTDKDNFDLVRGFYVDYLVAFDWEIELLFKIYNNHDLKTKERKDQVDEIMKTSRPIYKLTKLYGALQAIYYQKYGKEDTSKTKDRDTLRADFATKSQDVCTVCEEGLNKWFNNFDKMTKLKVFANKEDSPDGEDFVKKWFLGYAVLYGNYGKEFPGSVGLIQAYLSHVATIWDTEIFKKDADKSKRTGYKSSEDIKKEEKKTN